MKATRKELRAVKRLLSNEERKTRLNLQCDVTIERAATLSLRLSDIHDRQLQIAKIEEDLT
ncbi:MAG: hypothetical protein V1799_00575 [bacterium]